MTKKVVASQISLAFASDNKDHLVNMKEIVKQYFPDIYFQDVPEMEHPQKVPNMEVWVKYIIGFNAIIDTDKWTEQGFKLRDHNFEGNVTLAHAEIGDFSVEDGEEIDEKLKTLIKAIK